MDATAAVVGPKIYIIGQLGRKSSEVEDQSSICYFDVGKQKWYWMDIAGPWFDFGKVVLVNDYLLSFTGEEYNFKRKNANPWKLDLVELKWEETRSHGWTPMHRIKSSVDYMEEIGCVAIFGGCVGPGETDKSDLILYEPLARVWSAAKVKGTAPRPRHRHGSCSSGMDLFIYGGIQHLERLKDLFVAHYDVAQRMFTWSSLSMDGNLATPTASPSMNYAAGRLFIFGGFDSSDVDTNDFYLFDIPSKTWHRLANNSEYKLHGDTPPNSTHCAVNRYEGIYMLGGYGRPFPKIEVFKPH